MNSISAALQDFQTVPIERIFAENDPLLSRREDYKFVVPKELFPKLMQLLSRHYLCAVRGLNPVQEYVTTYLDTDDFKFFNQHRQGKFNRSKIRLRRYGAPMPMLFLEVKEKTRGRQTKKERKPLLSEDRFQDEFFLRKHFEKHAIHAEDLTQKTTISYHRIILVGKDFMSRASVDFNLSASQNQGPSQDMLPRHFILELKDRLFPKTVIQELRRELALRQSPFSKYCIALCLLRQDLKDNEWRHFIKRYCRS